MTSTRGRVAVVGAGPAGMAAALSIHQAGHETVLLERYPQARPAGNILNLWPPPIKALGLMGVDTEDLGAPCLTQFRNLDGRVRVTVHLPDDVVREYRGGFIGMLRPGLYERMVAALPDGVLRTDRTVTTLRQDDRAATLTFADGTAQEYDLVVGADGIDSLVRRTLWGETPKREHRLHIFGGYTFADVPGAERDMCVLTHSRTVQGSYSPIRHQGRDGYQWWVLEACDPDAPLSGELHDHATRLAAPFPAPLPGLVAATDPDHVQRWVLRDRPALPRWSKGRATIVGDAAHPTSPYAAYGAGMAIEDGYYLGRALAGVDLGDPAALADTLAAWEEPRRAHTKMQVTQAWILGKVFHHAPAPLRPLRDAVLDHTPLLQKNVGERSPGEIVAQLEQIDAAETRFRDQLPR